MSATAHETASTGDARWRVLTEAANHAFEQDRLGEALGLYRGAFDEADRLLAAAETGGEQNATPALYVISCQNLAEARRREDDDAAAQAWLLRAFERLADAAESPATPLGLRIDCMRELKFAFLGLIEPLRGDPAFETEIAAHVARGQRAVAIVFEVIKLVTGGQPGQGLFRQEAGQSYS